MSSPERTRPVFAGIGDEAAPDLAGQLAALAELGWDLLELRSVDGVPVAAMDERAFARAVQEIGDAGVRVVAVDSRIGNWSRPATGDFAPDLAEWEVLVRRCALLGTRLVRIMSYPSGGLDDAEWGRRVRLRLRELARRAEDAGLVLAHENCAGWAGESAERALDLLDAVDSPALRLLFDTGNGIAHGYGAPDMLHALVEHVVHVHVKDAVAGSGGDADYVPPGAGESGVAECLETLAAHGYTGALSLEPHLHMRPHLRASGTDPGRGDHGAFVSAGRALERLAARAWHGEAVG
ncbi:sugar phosphate isomerase/epimerase family protein [Nocardiopsis algeriensis]|uniref:sugar phosphate isomerase/epimerase family protein n=1 Tax=Nocardiopsis algeriensis TaxID=1478215 RepID=UPI003B42D9F8